MESFVPSRISMLDYPLHLSMDISMVLCTINNVNNDNGKTFLVKKKKIAYNHVRIGTLNKAGY